MMRTPVGRWAAAYLVAAVIFGILDYLWLTTVTDSLYRDRLGPLMADKPNTAAALAFYFIYLIGVTHFVTVPALERLSVRTVLVNGAILGLVAYATWDLTNLAVLQGFPGSIVVIDLIWGTLATAGAGSATYVVLRRLDRSRSGTS
ncbi:MAG: DUF2177 family protein [Nakamurella sp.]